MRKEFWFKQQDFHLVMKHYNQPLFQMSTPWSLEPHHLTSLATSFFHFFSSLNFSLGYLLKSTTSLTRVQPLLVTMVIMWALFLGLVTMLLRNPPFILALIWAETWPTCVLSYFIETEWDVTISLSCEKSLFSTLNILSFLSTPIKIRVRISLLLSLSRSMKIDSLPLALLYGGMYWSYSLSLSL